MPGFTFDQLSVKDEQVFTIQFNDGGEFHYGVAINRLNYDTFTKLQRLGADLESPERSEEVEEESLRLMADLLSSWDVVDSDGNPVPVTVESMRKLPVKMLLRILNDIKAQIDPNSLSGTSSSPGSATQTSRRQRRKQAAETRSHTG